MTKKLKDAIIMCAGRGGRIRPITIPKPLLPKRGMPIIEYMMDYLLKQGIENVTLTTCYNARMFDVYKNSNIPLNINVVPEKKFKSKHMKNDFLLVTGDILFDIDLQHMYTHHRDSKKDITVLVKNIQIPSGVISGEYWIEKPRFNIGVGAFIINKGIEICRDNKINIPETMKDSTKTIYGINKYTHLTSIEDYLNWTKDKST